jgi:hypothetical protein
MKTFRFLMTGLIFLGAAAARAQDKVDNSSRMAMHFGVKGGVNFATVTGEDFDSPDYRTNFNVGALIELPVADMFSVQAEALYSGQGFKSDVNGGILGGDGKVEYQVDYINVPVLAKIYATKGLSFEVGPQFDFKVNEEIDTENNDGNTIETSEAKSFQFGVAGGLTFQTQSGFFADGRYTYGLTDMLEDGDVHSSVFQVGVGYKF